MAYRRPAPTQPPDGSGGRKNPTRPAAVSTSVGPGTGREGCHSRSRVSRPSRSGTLRTSQKRPASSSAMPSPWSHFCLLYTSLHASHPHRVRHALLRVILARRPEGRERPSPGTRCACTPTRHMHAGRYFYAAEGVADPGVLGLAFELGHVCPSGRLWTARARRAFGIARRRGTGPFGPTGAPKAAGHDPRPPGGGPTGPSGTGAGVVGGQMSAGAGVRTSTLASSRTS